LYEINKSELNYNIEKNVLVRIKQFRIKLKQSKKHVWMEYINQNYIKTRE